MLEGTLPYESVPERHHRLLHLIPTSADYTEFRTEYASQQAFLRVWERAGAQGAAALQAYWKGSASEEAMRGQILEGVTKMDLSSSPTSYDERCLLRWFGPQSKTFSARRRQQKESSSQSITIQPGRRLQFTFDNTNYAQQLQNSWQQPGAWLGRTLLTPVGPTFPEVDCVMLPAPQASGTVERVELFQITVSKTKDIDREILANILCALPDAEKYILYFVVPKEQFKTFTVKSISRGSVSNGQARLDTLEARVIANVKGVDALHSYTSSSSSSSGGDAVTGAEGEDVISGDEGEDVISGDEGEDATMSDSIDSATTVVDAKD